MQLVLIDTQPDLVERWRSAFAPWPEVTVRHGDILAVAHTAIVSPANSLGLMDGGIDALYIDYFGSSLQRAVRGRGLVPARTSLNRGAARDYVSPDGHRRGSRAGGLREAKVRPVLTSRASSSGGQC